MEGHVMRRTIMLPAALAALLGLAACGEKEPSKLTYGEAAQELAKGADNFKTYIGGLDNKLVKWAGTIVETRKWHEDDFVPAAGMLVDADGKLEKIYWKVKSATMADTILSDLELA